MLHDVHTLKGYKLHCLDGEIGKVKEFFFDNENWAIRYLIANTGTWLTDRIILLSPETLLSINTDEEKINVNLTKKQIEESPQLESDKPVTRQYEETYFQYYGIPIYSGTFYMQGAYAYIDHSNHASITRSMRKDPGDPHLCSTQDTSGQHIQATDGEVGHVHSFIIDDENWSIRYLVIDTNNWWPGKKILIAPNWIEKMNWQESKVYVSLHCESIKMAPEYDHTQPITREYEVVLHTYYQKEGYWETPQILDKD